MKNLKKLLTMAISFAIVFGSFVTNANQPISLATASVLGDVTNDGAVTASDALSVKKFLAGSLKNIDFTLADVNCNSVVTTKDILLYHKFFAGHIQNFDDCYIGVPKLSTIENLSVTPDDMGLVAHNMYSNGTVRDYYARNVWDMHTYEGRVFFGTGNYDDNISGNAGLYYIDKSMSKTKLSKAISTEQISRFYEIDGKLYTASTDAKAWLTGAYYCYDYSNFSTKTWNTYSTLKYNIHCYDMVKFDGKYFFAGPNYDDVTYQYGRYLSNMCYIDEKDICTDTQSTLVPYYADVTLSDGTKAEIKLGNPSLYRTYDMFIFNGELYATEHCSDGYSYPFYYLNGDLAQQYGCDHISKYSLSGEFPDVDANSLKSFSFCPDGVYKYDRDRVAFKKIDGSESFMSTVFDIGSNRGYEYLGKESKESERYLETEYQHGDEFIVGWHDLYKTKDFVNFEKIDIGEQYKNYVIRDTIKVDGIYYFVASEKTKDMRYNNVVLKTTDFKTFTNVLNFQSDAFVRCFEYLNGTMYFSLGATKGEYSADGVRLTSNPYPDRYKQMTLDSAGTEVYIMNKACGRLLKVDFFKE